MPSQIDNWTTIVGVFLPLVIAVVNRQSWGAPLKALAALAICILAAAGDVYWKGQFSVSNWAETTLAIFVIVATSYVAFWKPTGLADAVEKRT